MMMCRIINKNAIAVVVVVFLFASTSTCQPKSLKDRIIGVWNLIDDRKIFPVDPAYYDQVIEVIRENEISFSEDYLVIQSGIYYLTNEEWPEGHYPWIFCGTHTLYNVADDRVGIYNPGYRTWKEFTVKMIGKDSMTLSSDTLSFSLFRRKTVRFDNRIESIHLKVVDVDPFLINYDVYVENDRIKIVSNNKEEKKAILRQYIDYLFENFNRVDVSQLPEVFDPAESENRILELDIEYGDGERKHSRIIGNDHPDQLKLALLPIIYASDFINHRQYWSEIFK